VVLLTVSPMSAEVSDVLCLDCVTGFHDDKPRCGTCMAWSASARCVAAAACYGAVSAASRDGLLRQLGPAQDAAEEGRPMTAATGNGWTLHCCDCLE
jgi:hypothetical protein